MAGFPLLSVPQESGVHVCHIRAYEIWNLLHTVSRTIWNSKRLTWHRYQNYLLLLASRIYWVTSDWFPGLQLELHCRCKIVSNTYTGLRFAKRVSLCTLILVCRSWQHLPHCQPSSIPAVVPPSPHSYYNSRLEKIAAMNVCCHEQALIGVDLKYLVLFYRQDGCMVRWQLVSGDSPLVADPMCTFVSAAYPSPSVTCPSYFFPPGYRQP